MKMFKEEASAGNGGAKETILKCLLAVFVMFLVGSFIYFLLIVPRAGNVSSSVKVYFLKGEKLFGLERISKSGAPPEKAALEALLVGPTREEVKQGIFSEIPDGVRAVRVFIEGDTVFADFNRAIGEYGGGSARVQGLVAQIVYTMTELPGIKRVGILVEGKSQVALGGEGYLLEKPLTRDDVEL